MANSAQFMDDLGPLAAMWAGRNQGMQENTTLVNQQNTLESIAKSQQDRDIARQKLPFELGQLEHQQKMNPLLMEEKVTDVAAKKAKFSKDQFDTFFGQFKDVLPTLEGTPADAAILGDLAKKNGIDPSDSRIQRMIATATSGNRAAVEEMMKRIALLSEKSIQERAKQADIDKAHGERTTAEIAGRERTAQIAADASLERAQIAAQARGAATQRLAAIEQRLVQLSQIRSDPKATPEEKARANQEAFELSQYKLALATAVNQQKTDQVLALLGQPTSGATPTAANPYAQPAQQPTQPAAQPPSASKPNSMPPGHEAQPVQAPAPAPKAPPAVGEVRGGYRFKGGNPADQANWEKIR